MLESERENSESADGRNEATAQNEGSGRGLLRRARRAVTRPAGPPAAELDPAGADAGTQTGPQASQPAASPSGNAAESAAGPAAAVATGGDEGTQAPGDAQPGAGSRRRTTRSRTQKAESGESAADSATAQPAGSGGSSRRADTAGGSGGSSRRADTAGGSGGSSSRADTAGGSGGSSSRANTAETGESARPARTARSSRPARAEESEQAEGGARSRRGAHSGEERSGQDEASAQAGPTIWVHPARAEEPAGTAPPAMPSATFQPPLVIFQAPELAEPRPSSAPKPVRQPSAEDEPQDGEDEGRDEAAGSGAAKRRRRGGRGRGKSRDGAAETAESDAEGATAEEPTEITESEQGEPADEGGDETASGRRRRRRRRTGSAGEADGQAADASADDPPNTVVHVRSPRAATESDVRAVKGSTRLEAKRQRRREGRESGRRRPPIITESEFLARREAVERVMVVRQHADRTQIAVLEDGVLVEHYVDKASHQSYVGNVYLGKVQNVLPSMEAAFVDIGKGRNAVLYAGEVNFDASGLEGESKRIESALKSGQSILVQVTKDPIGHKGARLTSQVSLPGRYLVYVPGASMTGISRKLPDTERSRLKQILKQVMPENAGVIVRTAAEGASEEELSRDVARLSAQWEAIERKAKTATAPDLLYSEPDLTLRVVRDIFNEDFKNLVIASDTEWDLVDEYVRYVAPHLADRMRRWDGDNDVFAAYRIDEQLAKALERKVWLPSGGSLVIDHTEAMNIIDVNTGKFTGQGGNLEQTVTRNNLEAAEEIVRQLRLRDLGGIIVIDFIDMVLESNRELVLRRLLECLARDRTKHQVAEVTSLGLVQMTRKRVGSGLLEAFSVPCEHCNGRGVIISMEPVDHAPARGRGDNGHGKDHAPAKTGAARGGKSSSARGGQGRGATKDARGANGRGGAEPAAGADEAPEPTGDQAVKSHSSRSRSGRSGRSGRGAAVGQDEAGPDGGVGSVAVAAADTAADPANSHDSAD
jgi:ribonuclease E